MNQVNFSGGKGQTTDLGEQKAQPRSYMQITAAGGLPRNWTYRGIFQVETMLMECLTNRSSGCVNTFRATPEWRREASWALLSMVLKHPSALDWPTVASPFPRTLAYLTSPSNSKPGEDFNFLSYWKMCGLYTVAEQIELGFMFHNLHGLSELFLYVFGSPITFLTVTFFFSFWEVGEKQRTCFSPFFTDLYLGVFVCHLWIYPCVSLVREYLHVSTQSVGLYVWRWCAGLQCVCMYVLNVAYVFACVFVMWLWWWWWCTIETISQLIRCYSNSDVISNQTFLFTVSRTDVYWACQPLGGVELFSMPQIPCVFN